MSLSQEAYVDDLRGDGGLPAVEGHEKERELVACQCKDRHGERICVELAAKRSIVSVRLQHCETTFTRPMSAFYIKPAGDGKSHGELRDFR